MLINFTNQPAYILHTRAYRDTSLLLEVYTKEQGRVVAIAHGVKRAKRTVVGLLQPFVLLSLSAKGRGEIASMTQVEQLGLPLTLAGQRQVAGLYVNELMVRLVGKFEASTALFEIYHHTLTQLQEGHIEILLRCFERRLIKELGYGLTFDITLPDAEPIVADRDYHFVLNQGFVALENAAIKKGIVFSGQTLLNIATENYSGEETRQGAKYLFRHVLQFHLGKKPLMSRQLWQKEGQ